VVALLLIGVGLAAAASGESGDSGTEAEELFTFSDSEKRRLAEALSSAGRAIQSGEAVEPIPSAAVPGGFRGCTLGFESEAPRIDVYLWNPASLGQVEAQGMRTTYTFADAGVSGRSELATTTDPETYDGRFAECTYDEDERVFSGPRFLEELDGGDAGLRGTD
jgi:hypothetical protein